MNNKLKNLFFTLAIALLALPMFGGSVLAADSEVVLEDGEYPIVVEVLKADEDTASGAAGFLGKDATLYVKDGQVTIEVAIPPAMTMDMRGQTFSSEVTGLQFNDTEAVSENVVDEVTYKVFALDSVTEFINAQVQYEVKNAETEELFRAGDDPIRYHITDFNNLVDQVTEEESEEASPVALPSEVTYIDFVSDSPGVNRQFNNPAIIFEHDGKTMIQMSGTGGQFIESLTINGEEVIWGDKHADGTFIFQFEHPGNISDVLDFGMVIDTGRPEIGKMEHIEDLSFDESTLRDTVEVIEEEEEQPEEQETPEAVGELVPDKATQIEYTILQDNSDQVSASMNFMDSTAILLEKDGVKYLQISTEEASGQYIKSLRVKLGDNYQEMVVVDRTEDGRTIFQLKVAGEITDVILLDMIIDVRGVYENQHHNARLILDPETSVELDASEYLLVASTNDNGPDGENAVDPEAAVEDSNETEEGDNQDTVVPTVNDGNPTNNPQTGENSNLILLTLLLIGSGSVIAYAVRKRLVA